jgi:DNA-binding NtrC family response regulator
MHKIDKPTVCFIDDDPKELKIFENVFGKNFNTITAVDFISAEKAITERRQIPNLFILDLYFSITRESSAEERVRMISLQQEVAIAQNKLNSYLLSIGQSRKGGLALLSQIQSGYQNVPVIFYTRKGTLEDSEICLKAGALYVAQKPSPEKLDPSQDIYAQLEKAANREKERIAELLLCCSVSKGVFGKIRRIAKFIITNWKRP